MGLITCPPFCKRSRFRWNSVKKRNLFFNIVFSTLGGLLLLFIVLPLLSILLGTTPETLWLAFTDPQVLNSIRLTFSAAAVATLLAIVTRM